MEWVAATFLSQDEMAMQEVWKGFDMHSDNQVKFGLPSRLIAKIFVFRLIYGGSAYSYSVDPDFKSVGFSQKRWQGVIDQFYDKYKGLHNWHTSIVQEVTLNGFLEIPTGRQYDYSPKIKPNGDIEWPRTTILNYPVQGFGADLMMLARLSFANRLRAGGYETKLISTVHDSIVCDSPDDEYLRIVQLFHEVFADIPKNFEKIFGIKLNVPMACEVLCGKNLKDMEEIKL